MKTITIDDIEYKICPQPDGKLLLKPTEIFNIIRLEDINKFDFSNSTILFCEVEKRCLIKNRYKSVLNYIYELIDDGVKIIRNSILNIKTTKRNDSGFTYNEKLGISVQGVDSNKCIYEIMKQCICNDIKLDIKIELANRDVVSINIYTLGD